LRASKQDAVKAVLSEAAAGFHADLATIADDLRQILTILAGIDRVVAVKDGSWSPSERIVVEIPGFNGVSASTCVAPQSAISEAERLWRSFANAVAIDPMAKIEDTKWPHVSGVEDAGRVVYADLSRAERQIIDEERAFGVN
jgi:hypothetical protein